MGGRRGSVVISHDAETLTKHACDRVRDALPMPGVIEIPFSVPLGVAIEDLILIAACLHDGEWEGQVRYLPL